MRARETSGGLTVQAIAGTKVVLFGMSVEDEEREGLLGFAIHCQDETTGTAYWLENLRVFAPRQTPGLESVSAAREMARAEREAIAARAQSILWSDDVPRGESPGLEGTTRPAGNRSDVAPIQAFRWGDYTAKPGHEYVYRVSAMYGEPGKLEAKHTVEIRVRTEAAGEGKHDAHFNRGVIASQGYTKRFGEKSPADVPDRAAFKWLSNGLEEALLDFIAQAKDNEFGLRAAVYEFNYAPVVEAFGAARARGADVKIVFDCKAGDGKPGKKNRDAIHQAGIDAICKSRASNPSYISHNKFIVLTHNGKPVSVWTGSTNITAGGIFGQSNVGHVVRDPVVAAKYLGYWEQLAEDPEARDLRKWNEANTPLDADPDLYPVFSPRPSLAALERYAELLGGAEQSAFFTAAFGVNQLLLQELDARPGVLRYVLLEKDGGDVSVIEGSSDNQAAAGAAIEGGGAWMGELDPAQDQSLNKHVFYIHDKFMILDAFGDSPTLITGSANFSDASTKNNDENMLVIRGDSRIVDIYLGEFMRLFTHYRFRSWAASLGNAAADALAKLSYLDPTDGWTEAAYEAGTHAAAERRLFAGA